MTLAIIAVLALSLLTYGMIALIRPPVKNTMSGNEIAHLATPDPLKIEGALALGKATEQRINDADGWVQLFNGKDLTGWKFHPDHQGDWEVKEGILKGSSRSSHLFSQRGDYANFHLRAEVQVNWGGDSGILFRTPFELERVSTANAITIPVGYEVDIQEYRSHPWRTGSILQVQNDASPIRLGAVTDNTLTQPDEWFTVEVIAVDNRFITKINGQETANCDDPFNRHSLGYLALQVWNPDTIVQYRKIEIKELPPSNSLRVDQGKRHFASDEWIDVIPLIDPRFDRWHVPKQTGKNDWRIEQNELVVARDVNASKLILPLDSDWSAFELEFEFTRRGGNSGFNVNLPTEFGECPLVVDAPGYSGGLSLGAKTKGKLLQIGAQIVTSERTMMHLEVHRQQDVDRVLVDLNGARIGEWSGDCNSISAKSYEGFPSDRRVSLWIFGGGNEFVFHRIRVRLLDGGTAESLRPAPTVALIPVTQLPVTQPPSGR